ncbi:MAG TPA: hypothetical protein VNH65_20990 [Candidatus Acidoferrum sp.]|nr:hypothetical protein [Candidatus Acidoferrum sp.]
MPSIEYSLFRARFVKPRQQSIFRTDSTPAQIFVEALKEKPSFEAREGYRWHIGNLRLFSHSAGYFAVGRTTRSTVEKFDEQSGDFLEEELETSPYTHCVFNADIGILGIAYKASLAPTIKGIAARIQQLLSVTKIVQTNGVLVEIAPIPDPQDFIRALETAYAVSRFTATFHGPNPFDADEYFQKPLSVYLATANGKAGKAEIKGEDLNREVLQSVTRSTAATGNEASARVRRKKAERPVTLHLRGDAVKRGYDEGEKPEAVLTDIEQTYERVRER